MNEYSYRYLLFIGKIEDFYDAYNNKQRRGSIGGIRLVRTISSIDGMD